jgi:cholera toxin transcriptional activator
METTCLTDSVNVTTGSGAPSANTSAYLAIRTGRENCAARFYPALYQLMLVRDGVEEKVDLGFSGSRLLERLVRNPGEVVPRDELMNHAWTDRVVGQGSLNQQIYTLRQVLGDEKNRDIIQTLPRRGYLLNPNYLLPEEVAEPEQPSVDEPVHSSLPVPVGLVARTQVYGANRFLPFALLGLLGLGWLGWFYHGHRPVELYNSELRLGNVSVFYRDANKDRLQQLMHSTQTLTQRLSELAQQPTRLFWENRGEFYELLCLSEGGHHHLLTFHTSQLGRIVDEQLRQCLR